MATEILMTDGNSVVATGWTNPNNTQAEDGTYATAAPAQNGVISSLFTFPASAIPAGATVRSVSAALKFKVSTAASIALLNVTALRYIGADPETLGGGSNSDEPIVDNGNVFSFDIVPSYDDVTSAGRLAVKVEAQRGDSGTAVTFSLDYVSLIIDYTTSADNDLGELHLQLETALRDSDNETWSNDEIDKLLTWACARMWPKVALRVRESVTLVDDQEQYTLTDVAEINRIDLLDEDGNLLRPLAGGTWEFWGDQESIGGTLFINRRLADATHSLRVHGWGQYDLVTNFPKDRHIQLILALARAEACRREVARRVNFTDWQSVNQVQNVSVNELVLMINESDAEARLLFQELKTWRRPSPAHVGR